MHNLMLSIGETHKVYVQVTLASPLVNHLGFQIKKCNSKLISLFLIKGLDKTQCIEYQF